MTQLKKISDEECRKFINIISFPLNKKEYDLLWNDFITAFHSVDSDLEYFIYSLSDAEISLAYEKSILFAIDNKDREEVKSKINNSIKLLGLPRSLDVYKKDSDYNLDVSEQVQLYALALAEYDYCIIEIEADDYLAVIIKKSDKDSFVSFVSRNNIPEEINYLACPDEILACRDESFRKNQLSRIMQLSPDARRLGLYILQDAYEPLFSHHVSGKYDDYKLTWDDIFEFLSPFFEGKDLWVGDFYHLLEIITGEDVAPALKVALNNLIEVPEYKGNGRTTCCWPHNRTIYTNLAVHLFKGVGLYLSDSKPLLHYATSCQYFEKDSFFTISLILGAKLEIGDSELKEFLVEQSNWHPIHLRTLVARESPSYWDVVIKRCVTDSDDNFVCSVVESLAFASMDAMPAFLKMILEEKLYLRTDVLVAFDNWTGLKWVNYSPEQLNNFISHAVVLYNEVIELQALGHQDSIIAVENSVSDDNNDLEVLAALWVAALIDRGTCEMLIKKLMTQKSQENKAVGLYFLTLVGINRRFQKLALEQLQHCDDFRVLYWAVRNLRVYSLGSHDNVFEILMNAMEVLPEYAEDIPFTSIPVQVCAGERCAAGKHIILSLLTTLFQKYPQNMEKFIPYFSQVFRDKIRLNLAQAMQYYFFEGENKPNKKQDFTDHQYTVVRLLSLDSNEEIQQLGYQVLDIELLIKSYQKFFQVITLTLPSDKQKKLWDDIEIRVRDDLENQEYHPDYIHEAIFDELTSLDSNDVWPLIQLENNGGLHEFSWQADAMIKTLGLDDEYDSQNLTDDMFEEMQKFSDWLDARNLTLIQLDNDVDFLGFVIEKKAVGKVLDIAKKGMMDVYVIAHLEEKWGKIKAEFSSLYE